MINYCKDVLLLTLIFLCGCARQPAPATYPVQVPVGISCVVEMPPDPPRNLPRLVKHADDVSRLRAALADRLLAEGYIEELKAVLAGCQ